uniref:NADH-ubiquinone oxidoreductase chain 4 n=1 Tax=Danionella mirifica TaxID=487619 RepID=F3Y705_9TELE|nr:NADH dehydrogenase subunit 4 [Danionella mirifica]
MLKILFTTISILPMIWLAKPKWIMLTTTLNAFLVATMSLYILKSSFSSTWTFLTPFLASDSLSSPLLVLSTWLLPLMLVASWNHILQEPANRKRTYCSLLVILQVFLIMAFSTTEFIMFYAMFEATMIPTLIIITRWGNQLKRLNAGTYFLFYTLLGSLPLLMAILFIKHSMGTLSMMSLQLLEVALNNSWDHTMWWYACMGAFLIKTPLYGVHLWLPKAHVEAPVAGSMVLAAILLKLGSYGMMRMISLLGTQTLELSYPFIALAMWGVLMTGVTCLRQTDLKSLIAYSSVGHMALVTAAILIQTPWGFSGALTLMIAHGFTSSALFCLANSSYERTHSRTMVLTRGMKSIFPLMTLWWLISSLANLALPPLPNLLGELMILTSLFSWSYWTIIFTGLGTVVTAIYSLYMFIITQHGQIPKHTINFFPSHSREHLLLALHLTPMLLLTFKLELIWGWWN